MKDLSLNLYCKCKAFAQDEEAATAIEYAVIAGLIIVALVGTLTGLKTQLAATFTAITTALTGTGSGN
ncbi:Flp family type IVb pilin [Pseudomonas citronellolis]|uniref:Flp family type IVb pilin n=1 Tax=Pseudomonas citronellolis TaxID=53408 RepID=UPI0023E4377A|nr:Flp family type IVb pilin [Pseudomonas citronellolis]MDF3932641.1 Flp family type IVb pilin [Pseudomonas citronellolis]